MCEGTLPVRKRNLKHEGILALFKIETQEDNLQFCLHKGTRVLCHYVQSKNVLGFLDFLWFKFFFGLIFSNQFDFYFTSVSDYDNE